HPRCEGRRALPRRGTGGRRQPTRGGIVPRLPRPGTERRCPAQAQWYDFRMTRAIVFLVIVLAAAALVSPVGAQQMYRWTDQNGRVHITDTPPPASAKGVQKKKAGAAAAPTPTDGAQTPYEL